MPPSGRIDPHPPPLHGELTVVSLSAVGDEVWAVGFRTVPGPALIAHTAGGEPWQLISYSSSSEAEHTQFSGVHATASGDVWVVGWDGLLFSNPEHTRTHIVHGDGTTWQPVESPDFGDGSHLSDVAAWGRDDAFAVGSRTSHPLSSGPLGLPPVAAHDTLAARWDGARWAAVPGPGRGVFGGVCAVGPGAYWAVGATALAERAGNVALVAHYAGGQWQQVGFEGIGALFDVAATGPDDVWAVGQDQAPGHLDDPLILHYDGHAWTPTGVPEIAGRASLIAVACAGRDNVWAVGFQDPEDGPFGPFVLHFGGSAWAAVEPPATAAPTSLQAVTALPGGAAWVAGFASPTFGDTGYTVPLVMSGGEGH